MYHLLLNGEGEKLELNLNRFGTSLKTRREEGGEGEGDKKAKGKLMYVLILP